MNNTGSYSQFRAMKSITKASLTALFRNPSAVVFNILFPLIFIIVFGFISGGSFRIDVALDPASDLNNPLMTALSSVPSLKIEKDISIDKINSGLSKGTIDGLLKLTRNPQGDPEFIAELTTSSASRERGAILKMILNDMILKQNADTSGSARQAYGLRESVVQGRKYNMIDFILPGQLGFSLLSAGVFGTAFIFLILRQTLVIKRFFATPVSKMTIIIGECISRLTFSMMSSVIIILIGTLFFGFTLVNGFTTFLNMMILSAVALVVFLGFGFVVSGIAKSESTVPPIANLITLPQFLLAGTFFPVSNFPEWLQPVSKILPLTYLNEALRRISFEGASMIDVLPETGILLGWGVVLYIIAAKVFRWE
ncbi:MAG: ABC transporter permease [Ignavibacteria bacterium]|nr:ABC transporter permease [Ignavibacteria bacterium]